MDVGINYQQEDPDIQMGKDRHGADNVRIIAKVSKYNHET